jgi:hypothetical protein
MKPLSLNLKNMKKIEETEDTSTFLHPNGHKMVIAHAPLSSLQVAQMQALPLVQYAEGGMTHNSYAEGGTTGATGTPDQAVTAPAGGNEAPVQGQLPAPEITPEPPKEEVQREPAGKAKAEGASKSIAEEVAKTSDVLPNAFHAAQEANTMKAQIDSDVARDNLQSQNADINARTQLYQEAQQNYNDIFKHAQLLANDYTAGHINPNQYMEEMGGGQKVAQAIGLLVGGFSAPFNGGKNPAMDWLNTQIDRNIKAQQANMENRKNLLGANLELLKNMPAAMNMTRANMDDMLAHEITTHATKQGTAIAQNNAQMANSQLGMDKAQALKQAAIQTAVFKRMQNGGQGLSAFDMQQAGLLSPEQAEKEQGHINNTRQTVASVKSVFNQLSSEQNLANRVLNPLQSKAKIDAANAQLDDLVLKSDVNHRLNDTTLQEALVPFRISLTDDQNTQEHKLQGVLQLVHNLAAGGAPFMEEMAPASTPGYGYVNKARGSKGHPREGQTGMLNGKPVKMINGVVVPIGKSK